MRVIAPYLLVGAAIALCACKPSQPTVASPAATSPGPASQSTALWSIEPQNPEGKIARTLLICADANIHDSFMRPVPNANGQDCRLIAPMVQDGGRFAARCRSAGHLLDVQAQALGDTSRDFTEKLLIQTDVRAKPSLAQTIRYRQVGACPEGWASGDAAAVGDNRTVNAVSGAVRRLATPVAAPGS